VRIGEHVSLLTGVLVACTSGCGASSKTVPFDPGSTDAAPVDAGAENTDTGVDMATATGDDATGFGVSDGGVGALSCQAGNYVGTYMGTNDSSKVGGPTDFPISGPMQITLVQSAMQNGEFLEVTTGATFDAVWGGAETADSASGLIVTHATLAGQLDCSNAMFTAMSTSAMWTVLGIPAGDAMAEFMGTYDPGTMSIGGTFNISSAIATSIGTWTVTLTP
jgi:hypothetical protein